MQNKYIKYFDKNIKGGNQPISTNNIILNCIKGDFCVNNEIQVDKFIEKMKDLSMIYCDDTSFRMIVGIVCENGDLLFSLQTSSPMGQDIHAEHTLIQTLYKYEIERGMANKGKLSLNYLMLVCVNSKGMIKAPCGICRELLKHYLPNTYVIVKNDIIGKYHDSTMPYVMIQAKYLLPYPYISSSKVNKESITTNKNIIFNIVDQ